MPKSDGDLYDAIQPIEDALGQGEHYVLTFYLDDGMVDYVLKRLDGEQEIGVGEDIGIESFAEALREVGALMQKEGK